MGIEPITLGYGGLSNMNIEPSARPLSKLRYQAHRIIFSSFLILIKYFSNLHLKYLLLYQIKSARTPYIITIHLTNLYKKSQQPFHIHQH